MLTGLRLVLLIFAAVGFGGAGAALAVSRYRAQAEGERDLGMTAVAAMLFLFGALCTTVASGLTGILAFGALATWCSYVFTGQHVGLFTVEVWRSDEAVAEPPRSSHRAS